MHKKTMSPRSCLKWKPTGRVFKNVVLRWVPTGKTFASSTTKVESEQALDVSASVQASVDNVKWRLLKITLQAPILNVQMMSDHNSSDLVPQRQEMS
ncbi:hypothetical protein Tco_0081880, partial [Tanacetum coccineum]